MSMLAIQKGIPLPEINRTPRKTSRQRKYPVDTMVVGDMIFMEGRSTKSASAYISRITKDLPGKFSLRHCWMRNTAPAGAPARWHPCEASDNQATEGTGVWRIE